jgi:hypothetical protein
MLDLVIDGYPTAGSYLVRDDGGTLVAQVDRHWSRTSFVVRGDDGQVLRRVERGGLVFVTWVGFSSDEVVQLKFRSTFFGGRISFADGRSARAKRRLFRVRWKVVDEGSGVLADGRAMGSRRPLGSRKLAVRMDQHRLAMEDAIAIAETFRLDHSRRKRRPGVIADALNRHRPVQQRGASSAAAETSRGSARGRAERSAHRSPQAPRAAARWCERVSRTGCRSRR